LSIWKTNKAATWRNSTMESALWCPWNWWGIVWL